MVPRRRRAPVAPGWRVGVGAQAPRAPRENRDRRVDRRALRGVYRRDRGCVVYNCERRRVSQNSFC